MKAMEQTTVKSSPWEYVVATSALRIADSLTADANPTEKDMKFSTKLVCDIWLPTASAAALEVRAILHRNLILMGRKKVASESDECLKRLRQIHDTPSRRTQVAHAQWRASTTMLSWANQSVKLLPLSRVPCCSYDRKEIGCPPGKSRSIQGRKLSRSLCVGETPSEWSKRWNKPGNDLEVRCSRHGLIS